MARFLVSARSLDMEQQLLYVVAHAGCAKISSIAANHICRRPFAGTRSRAVA
jgi:hypothetical protein